MLISGIMFGSIRNKPYIQITYGFVSSSSQVHEELSVLRDGVLQLLHGAGHGALAPQGGPRVAQPRLQTPQVLLKLTPVLAAKDNGRHTLLVMSHLPHG